MSVRALASLLVLCAAAPAAAHEAARSSALERVADSVAASVLAGVAGPRRTVALAVRARQGPRLARAAETALAAALHRGGASAVLLLPGEALEACERAAQAAGVEALVRLEVALEAGQLVAVGDWLPTWVNFWAGEDSLRGRGGAPLAFRLPADEGTLGFAATNAAPAAAVAAPRFRVRPFAELPGRVVALAVGDLDGRAGAELAVLTEAPAPLGLPEELQVQVFGADGALLAHAGLAQLPLAARPPREPAGALAISPPEAPGGSPRLMAFAFERARAAVFELNGATLALVDTREQIALGHGLLGQPVEGKNLLATEVVLPDGTAGRLPFPAVALVPNPSAANPAWFAVGEEGKAAALGETLEASEVVLPRVGAGSALGDFDGDGRPELAASLPVRAADRVRVLRLAADGVEPLYESEPLSGLCAVAAAGDLGGEGRSEAIFASWLPEGRTALLVLEVER